MSESFLWSPASGQEESRWMTGPSLRLQKIVSAEVQGLPTFLNIQQISLEGMRVHADQPFEPGTSLRIQLHTDELLDLPVHVDFHKELVGGMWMVGLRFEPATDAEVRSIEWLVQTLALQNRRKHVRVNRRLVVQIQEEESPSFTMDLSAGGMRLLREAPLTVGDEVPLRIVLEHDLPAVEVRGRVAWQREASFDQYQLGIQFVEVAPEAAHRIDAFVDAVLAGELAERQIPTLQGFDAE